MEIESKLTGKMLDYYKLKEFEHFTLYAVYEGQKFLYKTTEARVWN